MNIFEFENERFGKDLWTKESITECRKSEPKREIKDFLITDNDNDYQLEKYREYQEQNFNEYFTGSYKYCLWK